MIHLFNAYSREIIIINKWHAAPNLRIFEGGTQVVLLCCQKQGSCESPRKSVSANHQSKQLNSGRCVLHISGFPHLIHPSAPDYVLLVSEDIIIDETSFLITSIIII